MDSSSLRAAADGPTLPQPNSWTETLAELQASLERHAQALRSFESNGRASDQVKAPWILGQAELPWMPGEVSQSDPVSESVMPAEACQVDALQRYSDARASETTITAVCSSHCLPDRTTHDERKSIPENKPWPTTALEGLPRFSTKNSLTRRSLRSSRPSSESFDVVGKTKTILQSLRPQSMLRAMSMVAVTRKPKEGDGWRSSGRNVFPDAEDMKQKVRDFICVPEKHVFDDYYETGCMQRIAKSPLFEIFTFVVILANAFYLAFEVSLNDEEDLNHAHPAIQIAEHGFCFLFTAEWLVRFLAFRYKSSAFRDQWMVFDTVLVAIMVLETWVFTFYILISESNPGTNMGATSLLRIGRLVRMSRVARIGRLFRAFPEIMLIVRSLLITVRTVSLIMFVLLAFVYVFAIILTQLCKGSSLGSEYFPNVPTAMFSLTLGAIFPDMAEFTHKLGASSPFYAALFLLFTVFTTIIVMNMLIGALVEVVGVVAAVERERNEAVAIKEQLQNVLKHLDNDEDGTISRAEFQKVMENPDAVLALHKVGVDACGLVETAHILFHEKEEFAFEDILEILLSLRGANACRVSDLTNLRRYFHSDLSRLEANLAMLIDPQKAAQIPPRATVVQGRKFL